jgi:hypothetical protein
VVAGRRGGGELPAGVGDRGDGGGAGMKKKEAPDGRKKKKIGGSVVG